MKGGNTKSANIFQFETVLGKNEYMYELVVHL